MNIPNVPIPPSNPRVWDWFVPIVTTKNITHAYLTETIEEPSYYNELCHLLRESTPNETVYLYINTPGGMIDSAFMIIDAMKFAQAHIIGKLSGSVCSAGTLIAMACDDIEVADHISFMVHNYSAHGIGGKGNELKSRQAFMDKSLEAAFTGLYEGFFTTEEMREIIDGKDYWMDRSEVLERWENKKSAERAKIERITDATNTEEGSTTKLRPKGRTRKV